MNRCSQVRRYYNCSQDIHLQKYTFSLQSPGQFCIGGQFENEVVNLTNGDYNGNLYLRKKLSNMMLYVVFGLPLV